MKYYYEPTTNIRNYTEIRYEREVRCPNCSAWNTVLIDHGSGASNCVDCDGVISVSPGIVSYRMSKEKVRRRLDATLKFMVSLALIAFWLIAVIGRGTAIGEIGGIVCESTTALLGFYILGRLGDMVWRRSRWW